MDGFLCLDKPSDVTSRAVVNQIQRLVRRTKVGHAGTLDPLATGVLVVALGRATRLVPYVQGMTKTYHATFLLGKTSDTEDVTGQLVERAIGEPPDAAEVALVCDRFVGEILQRPPAYSALKVGGKRAYQLARAGQNLELTERPIVIHGIAVTAYAFPRLEIDVECGSGTYIRSLGRDIGEALNCGAVMSQLRRTRIGEFRIEDAYAVESVDNLEAINQALRPAQDGVAALPQLELNEEQCHKLSHGQKILVRGDGEPEFSAVDSQGRLAAVLIRTAEGSYRPSVNFIAE